MAGKLPFGVPERAPFVRSDDGKSPPRIHYDDLLFDAQAFTSNSFIYDAPTRIFRSGAVADAKAIYWGLMEMKAFVPPGFAPVSADQFVAAWETNVGNYKDIKDGLSHHAATLRRALLSLAHGGTENIKEEMITASLGQVERRQFYADGKFDAKAIEAAYANLSDAEKEKARVDLSHIRALAAVGAPVGAIPLGKMQDIMKGKVTEEVRIHPRAAGVMKERDKTVEEIHQELITAARSEAKLSEKAYYNLWRHHDLKLVSPDGQIDFPRYARLVDGLAAKIKALPNQPELKDHERYALALEQYGISVKHWDPGRVIKTPFWRRDIIEPGLFEKEWKVGGATTEDKIKHILNIRGHDLQSQAALMKKAGRLYNPDGDFHSGLVPLYQKSADPGMTIDHSALQPRGFLRRSGGTDTLDMLRALKFDTRHVTVSQQVYNHEKARAGADTAALVTGLVTEKPSQQADLPQLFKTPLPKAEDKPAPQAAPKALAPSPKN